MAENKSDSWFGSWLNAAKNKSTEVLEFVKKDLEEFGTAVKNEASSVVSSAGSVMEKTFSLDSPDSTANTMKKSFSTFLGQVNTVLNPTPDDSDQEAILIIENSETVTLNKLQQALYELQKNPETYLNDPEPAFEQQFKCWLEIIDDQLSDDRIARQVNSSEILKRQYAKLVPEIVEHQTFWKRYLFKKALLEDEIARQDALEKRDLEKAVSEKSEEDNFKWEKEEFAADIELTEEEQIKLLEQYENEKKSTKKKNSVVQSPTKNSKEGEKKKKDLDKADSVANLESPSSGSSVDDEWEKVGDVEK